MKIQRHKRMKLVPLDSHKGDVTAMPSGSKAFVHQKGGSIVKVAQLVKIATGGGDNLSLLTKIPKYKRGRQSYTE